MSREQRDLIVQQLTIFVLALGLAVSSCAKVTPATPKAAAAIKADEVVLRVNELQAATITACWPDGVPKADCVPGGISTAAARELVKAAIDVRTTAKAVPEGWQATVKTAWAQARPRITALGTLPPAVMIALQLVDALIGGLS